MEILRSWETSIAIKFELGLSKVGFSLIEGVHTNFMFN